MRINVLTPGFTTSNGSAFLFPFVAHRHTLRDASIGVRFVHRNLPALLDCDVLAIDSKEFKNDWGSKKPQTQDLIGSYRGHGAKIVWFDTTDSSGTLQSGALPFVDKYLKAQLLADTTRYTEHIYGGREHSDFYHRTASVNDDGPAVDDPASPENLDKLGVSWNSGLANYSTYGPMKVGLYRKTRIRRLLSYPQAMGHPNSSRSVDVSARFGASYSKATVRYQREQIRELLGDRFDTSKLNRRGYMKELRRSKLVLSPFGWGEITLKDFEVFLTGGLLLKPAMDHLVTWPNFFESGVTCLTHDWNLTDLGGWIEWALENSTDRQAIAAEGQKRYIEYTSGPHAPEIFVEHLRAVLSK